jgi:preprotein translocase subunit SecD
VLGAFATATMAAEVVLTIAEARVPDKTEEPRRDVVYVTLDPASKQALADFSAAHIGEMAEFRVEDEVVFSARLSGMISTGSLALYVGENGDTNISAEELFEQLSTGASITLIAPAPGAP